MWLESFELGELLHQLFYAVLLKLYCNLGVVPIAFAAKDGALAVFGVADARALAQAGLAGGGGDVKFGAREALSARNLLPARGEEAGDVVDGAAGGGGARDGARAGSDARGGEFAGRGAGAVAADWSSSS